MEKTTFAPAPLCIEPVSVIADTARDASADEPRPLADWELVMVGGGDMTPEW